MGSPCFGTFLSWLFLDQSLLLLRNLFMSLGFVHSGFLSAAPILPVRYAAPALGSATLLLLEHVLWASFSLPTSRQTISCSSGKCKLNKVSLASCLACCSTDVQYVKVLSWTQEIEHVELKKPHTLEKDSCPVFQSDTVLIG